MQIEKAKAGLRENRFAMGLMAGPIKLLSRIQAPQGVGDLPGSHRR